MMQNNQALVWITTLSDYFREFEINYGILPTPKADVNQENYIHTVSTYNIPMFAVPVSAQKPDEISFVLEAMAYDSYYDVLPVFYESYLESKLARDKESVDMLQIIHSTLVLNPGAAYGWGGYLSEIYKVVNQGNNTLVTFDAAKHASAEKTISDLITQIQAGNED